MRHTSVCAAILRTIGAALLATIFAAAFALGLPHGRAHADSLQTRTLLVIVAGFDGGAEGTAASYSQEYDWGQTIFGQGDTLAGYYLDMSLGAFTFSPARETSAFGVAEGESAFLNSNAYDAIDDGIVHVTVHRSYRGWGLVNDDSEVASDFSDTVIDAFKAAEAYVDYEKYDTNSNGVLTADELTVAILVPGYDASTLTEPGRTDLPVLWPHSGTISKRTGVPDDYEGMVLDSYIALPENLWFEGNDLSSAQQEPLGILYHELGHTLGLPDLYALDKDVGTGPWSAFSVDSLSIMASGAWTYVYDAQGLAQYEPVAFDAWSRYTVGWACPQVVTHSGDYTVTSADSPQGYTSLLVPTESPDQYFLIENRQVAGHDASLGTAYPSSASYGGLVIWHIDKGIYRSYCDDNGINDTTHRPAIMPVFFETLEGTQTYSTSWQTTTPDKGNPFFSADSMQALLGSDGGRVTLPLYDTSSKSGDDDAPAKRLDSGIVVTFESGSAQAISIHIELPDEVAGTSSAAYSIDGDEGDMTFAESTLAALACAALLTEADADVSIIDSASIRSGIPKGDVSFEDVYAVLSADTTIKLFDVTGEQLAAFEESLARLWVAQRQGSPADGGASIAIGGLSFTVDLREQAEKLVSSMMVGSQPLRSGKTYKVAVTQTVADRFNLDQFWHRNVLEVAGSPADALRSFIQHKGWERVVNDLPWEWTYIEDRVDEPEPEPEPDEEPAEIADRGAGPGLDLEWVFAGVSIAVALIVFAGIAASIRRRTRRQRYRRR